jgi:hypothetical protein
LDGRHFIFRDHVDCLIGLPPFSSFLSNHLDLLIGLAPFCFRQVTERGRPPGLFILKIHLLQLNTVLEEEHGHEIFPSNFSTQMFFPAHLESFSLQVKCLLDRSSMNPPLKIQNQIRKLKTFSEIYQSHDRLLCRTVPLKRQGRK